MEGCTYYAIIIGKGFIQDYLLGDGDFLRDGKQMYVKQTACKPHPSRGIWGHAIIIFFYSGGGGGFQYTP